MKNLLISPEDTITIPVILAELKNGSLVADESVDVLKEIYEGDLIVDSCEPHEVVFRRPAFGDTVDMVGKVTTHDGVNMDFNPYAIRFERMCKLLKSWTFKAKDKPIPATTASLAQLHPLVANYIGARLDAEIGSI